MSDIERVCARKDCSNAGKHKCSGCANEFYCSKECQKLHWTIHKSVCKGLKAEEVSSFDDLSIKQLKTVLTNKVAELDNKKREKILTKLEKIVEKPALIDLVSKHVDIGEAGSLLKAPAVSKDQNSCSAARRGAAAAANNNNNNIKYNQNFAMPSPDQMKQQAAMLRSNPQLVRQSQPAFANYTDEQIRQIADQLDQAASDPNSMEEVERMFKLSNDDRGALQKIQEGLSGVRKIDSAWIEDIVMTLKEKPEVFKTLFRGAGRTPEAANAAIQPDQMEGFIDMASKMDAWSLSMLCHGVWYLSTLVKPSMELYKVVDSYTFGAGRYIFLGIFAMLAYYVSKWMYWLLRLLFVQVYALAMYAWAMFNGTGVAQTVTNTAHSTLETVGAAAGGAKVAETLASGAKAAAASTNNNADAEFEF
jgi:hypothetical protein